MLFGKARRAAYYESNLKAKTPGPGSYAEFSKTSRIRNSQAYSMGTGLRPGPVKAGTFTPGPGEYNSIKANENVSNKRAARAISMG